MLVLKYTPRPSNKIMQQIARMQEDLFLSRVRATEQTIWDKFKEARK